MGFKPAARSEKYLQPQQGIRFQLWFRIASVGVNKPMEAGINHKVPAVDFETPFIDPCEKPSPEIPLAY